MALCLEEKSILSAEICNRQKGHVKVVIQFVDGSVMRASLRGNPCRDLAGRTLKLRHSSPDFESSAPDHLAPVQVGVTGDITAARKVKVPLLPREVSEYCVAERDIPFTWKNSIYLEWYSRANGRVVLEASELELKVNAPAWEMSDREAEEAREAAAAALSEFLDELCVIDGDCEEDADNGEEEPMNEFEWEKFLRHSDDLTSRYSELVEKFGLDDEDSIARYMHWDFKEKEGESAWREDYGSREVERSSEESSELRRHPLQGQARQLLNSVDYPTAEPDSPLAELWGAVATVSAKLAGALSSYECDPEPDAGFTIAQLKRCLVHIDMAVGEAQEASPTHVQPLLLMRQAVIDLQNELRKSM
ncbi:MAG: hypothetical protein ABGZ49_01745 [Akkermansiaceae bacterium]